MLIVLHLAAVLSGQSPPAPPTAEARVETRSEIRVVATQGMDTDGDGFVTREEFSAPTVDAFTGLDKDGDDRLSNDEFGVGGVFDPVILKGLVGVERPGAGVRSFRLRRPGGAAGESMVFQSLLNGLKLGDGPIGSRLEIIRADDEAGMDRDGDGRVTEEEFVTPRREAFRRLDKDGSGVLEDGEWTGRDAVTIVTRPTGDD